MPDITDSQVMELADAKLKRVAKRVLYTFQVAGEKAVAHHADPAKYPLPADSNSAEHLFLARFRELKPGQQQAAVARVMASVKAPEAERNARFGALARVNLKLPTSVEAQTRALEFPAALKFPANHLMSLTNLHGHILGPVLDGTVLAGLAPQQSIDKLECRIHQVKCVDETNPEGGGDDDIELSGTSVDENGSTHKVARFEVGDFGDGDVKNYSPARQFTWFNLLEGGIGVTSWPKRYFVTLVLAEVDWGGLGDFVHKLLKKLKEEIKDALKDALLVGVGIGVGSLAGPIGAAVGAALGWVLGKLFDWIRDWLNDEVFAPCTITCDISSLAFRWPGNSKNSPQRTVRFRGYGGTYTLTYDWRVFS